MPDAREDGKRFPAFIGEIASRFHAFTGRELDERDPYLEIIQIYFILQDVLFQRSDERLAEIAKSIREPEQEASDSKAIAVFCAVSLAAGCVLGFFLGRL